jgi:hypothetical protein
MKTIELSVSWNGTRWDVQSDGNPPPGTKVSLTIPAVDKPTKKSKKTGPLLFSKGQYVYHPVEPDKNESEAWRLWEQHKTEQRPMLSTPPEKALIPILLEDDLHLSSNDSTNLAPCRCSYGGKTYDSLNKAASAAVNQWTNRITDSVGVFKSLCFLHDGMRLRLDLKRVLVIEGTPLPTRKDAGEGTRWLFGEEDLA